MKSARNVLKNNLTSLLPATLRTEGEQQKQLVKCIMIINPLIPDVVQPGALARHYVPLKVLFIRRRVFFQSRSKTIKIFSFTLSTKSAGKSPTLLTNLLLSIARI